MSERDNVSKSRLLKRSGSKAGGSQAKASGYLDPRLEVPSKQPDSAVQLPWQQSAGSSALTVPTEALAVNLSGFFRVRVSHLTRGSVSILLCVNFVVLGDFDPLVGLHTGLTQPLSALHTKTDSSRIVLAACAHLKETTPMKIKKISILGQT